MIMRISDMLSALARESKGNQRLTFRYPGEHGDTLESTSPLIYQGDSGDLIIEVGQE